ncbi:ABC transporter, periplasmic substrate-binding protein [Roseibium sp. TrichSKD4]|uniref:MlaD family protein n=1 Tax=Roseibium sp. TrichSKD4 TaxID=744980 RepID=UPI0001E574A2|nr:MCE family protein [Roseibium sp. TrichSKD4]EFO30809.1 ABC transporter, periplasmic substrate-binding protein [Roseibium sp. TrichSKD4]
METRANYVVIGAFMVGTLALAFGFIYWLALTAETRENVFFDIVFPAPVTGLPVGGQVLFNGIKVGDVSQLNFDRTDPTKVVATVRVKPDTPLRKDTKATLNFTGLTGVAYVDLNGGSLDSPLLFTGYENLGEGPRPVIYAEKSLFDDITGGARDVLHKIETTLDEVEGLLVDNRPAITKIVTNVETFSTALASNSDGVSDFMASLSSATEAFVKLSGRMETLVVEGERILAAIPSDKVTDIVDNVDVFTDSLGKVGKDIEVVLADAQSAAQELEKFSVGLNAQLDSVGKIVAAVNPEDVQQVVSGAASLGKVLKDRTSEINTLISASSTTMDNLASVSTTIREQDQNLVAAIESGKGVLEKADVMMARGIEIVDAVDPASVQQTVASVESFTTNLNASLGRVDAIVAAVDPVSVQSVVDDTAEIVSNFRAQEAQINEIITATRSSIQNIESVTATVRGEEDRIIALIDDLRVASVQFTETLASADTVISAVKPEQVANIVGSVETMTGGLSAQKQTIDEIILSARATAQNVEKMSENLASRTPDVDQIITDAKQLTANLNATSVRIQGIVDNVGTMVDADGEGLIKEATAAAASIRKIAEAFESRAGTIADGLAKFANQGSSDFAAAMEQVNRTLISIQRAVESFDRNPQRVIFGGEQVPTYTGNRR